jgi:prefoldin subunit 5
MREEIQKKLDKLVEDFNMLVKEREALSATIEAHNGAIQVCKQLLETDTKAEVKNEGNKKK